MATSQLPVEVRIGRFSVRWSSYGETGDQGSPVLRFACFHHDLGQEYPLDHSSYLTVLPPETLAWSLVELSQEILRALEETLPAGPFPVAGKVPGEFPYKTRLMLLSKREPRRRPTSPV